jgi:hypothetical protein
MPLAYENKHMPHCRTASKLMRVRVFLWGRMRGWERCDPFNVVSSHPLAIALSHGKKDA